MKTMRKFLTATAVAALVALPVSTADAWWGGGFGFSFGFSGSGWGRNWYRPWYGYRNYGYYPYHYGYYPSYYHYPVYTPVLTPTVEVPQLAEK
ncbi:MAG: hypothetical protein OI74_11280 [Gammaproteobacteria bacterium (ex Lamellibrachia satsuma)]|nr:MAG: hypothetical protein OI74_11280 [Gammaproteobacteria bacterium (ex Lamellibrachia satsuma)]RRS34507.1 MAG: hypothetical protein NV67_12695 [Gammaproteobacteria bacterium (ex Lamellibrachia satsuma)]